MMTYVKDSASDRYQPVGIISRPSAGSRRLGLAALLAIASASAASAQPSAGSAVADLPGFASETVAVNGARIHFVRGGDGPAIVLIHGFPESWYVYHSVMPALAKRFTVIAVDLRGIGGSSTPDGRFDAATMATDVHALSTTLKVGPVYVVGHDVGAMVAYAYARRFPNETSGAMLMDAPIPGLAGWDNIRRDPSVWHFHFMQTPGLAEKLVTGRQADYFAYFYQFGRITPAEANQYAQAYSRPYQLHAAFEIYRAFPQDAQENAADLGANAVPVTIVTGDKSPFKSLAPAMAADLSARGFSHVQIAEVPDSVHYLVDDAPDGVAKLIEQSVLAAGEPPKRP
jgi:pimeloyl-ACP methyl ester carboxylesterase